MKLCLVGTLLVMVFGSACGYAPTAQSPADQTASPARTNSPIPSASPLPSTSQWTRHSDATYQFSISYPPGFALLPESGLAGTGMLGGYRTVDSAHQGGYPPGQIEITIYTKDADTLGAWVAKHSGPPSSSDKTRYWSPVSNLATLTIAGREGLTFDWIPDTGHPTIHDAAIFLSAGYVLTVSWWSNDPKYDATLQQYYRQMLADLQA